MGVAGGFGPALAQRRVESVMTVPPTGARSMEMTPVRSVSAPHGQKVWPTMCVSETACRVGFVPAAWVAGGIGTREAVPMSGDSALRCALDLGVPGTSTLPDPREPMAASLARTSSAP